MGMDATPTSWLPVSAEFSGDRQPILGLLLLSPLLVFLAGSPASAEIQQRCDGALLAANGTAAVERPIHELAFSLSLTAAAPTADAALLELQRRLAAVRSGLRSLGVAGMQVASPGTWQEPVEGQRRPRVLASLTVSGRLPPDRLQPLVREVGRLPGVRLSPVDARPARERDSAVRAHLLRMAYRDALAQATEVGVAIGRPRLSPLEVQLGTMDAGATPVSMPLRSTAPAEPPPFEATELPLPRERLSMLVRFCAR